MIRALVLAVALLAASGSPAIGSPADRQIASWYCLPGPSPCSVGYPATGHYAAAGPALRVGVWRGRWVTVCSPDCSHLRGAVLVQLVDSCACPGRLIDLYASAFSWLAPLSRGLVRVEVKPARQG